MDAQLTHAGNRFDVPGGGVLYCCSEIEGCYRETLARLRVSPAMRQLDEDNDNQYMRAGCIPSSWRESRRIFSFRIPGALPFLDVEAQSTMTVLDAVLAPRPDPIDVAAVRGGDRLLTREIALWAYVQVDGDGDPLYGGIRYFSRVGNFACWAIFAETYLEEVDPPRGIGLSDPALVRTAREFGLTLN